MKQPLPPFVSAGDRIVLFDGACALCSAWSHFLTAHDRQGLFKLAAVQSRTGQALLGWLGLPVDRFDTMLFVDRGRAYVRSEAVLRVMRYLPWPWRGLAAGVVIPRSVRDWAYDWVARHRYRWFGKLDQCLMPGPEIAARFLP